MQTFTLTFIVDKSSADISLHVKWMDKYNELNDSKKTAIENWKTMHNAEKHFRKYKNKYLENQPAKTPQNVSDPQNEKQELDQWRMMKVIIKNAESQKQVKNDETL